MDSQYLFHDANLLEPIAIVGLSLQFPGGVSRIDSLWEMIQQARCVSKEFPADRINANGAYWPQAPIRGGHFITDDITAFDAPFFSLSEVEAASIDPQQRLLLEMSYIAFENAGIPISHVEHSNTSVYIGCFTDDYRTLYKKDLRESAPYAATGITTTLNANRISWFYNLTGPSINIDTACSSSLVALHLACQGLQSGEAQMSLVGGANLLLAPDLFHILSDMNMLSPESRCHSFDARANGYGRGEGIAVLVLKRLDRAIHDGDTIRALIRSTACNQNGHTPSITQPSPSAQASLVDKCYAQAGLDKRRTAYVEAHGTGTPVGDPAEAEALGRSFRDSRLPGEKLYVGSLKANIGHLEGASGIASVIKAIAVLESGVIPPIAGLHVLNPMIDEDKLGLQFPRHAERWPKEGLRRISVNSFGFGGSNAHAILDDAYHFLREHEVDGIAHSPHRQTTGKQVTLLDGLLPVLVMKNKENISEHSGVGLKCMLLPLSSRDEAGVHRVIEAYGEYFASLAPESTTPDFLDALSYTLIERRSWLSWRTFAVVTQSAQLENFASLMPPPRQSLANPEIVFVFTGQGAQWPQMGKELQHYAVFRCHLEESESYLRSIGCEWLLVEELLRPDTTSRIHEPQISQVLCAVVQMALVDLLTHFKIRPSIVIGHSSGEIAAAYCCGAISARSAWRIAYFRGTHVSTLKGTGGMLAVGLGPSQAATYLTSSSTGQQTLSIACYNSPSSVTISGNVTEIETMKKELDRKEIFARKLQTGVAYHSAQMEHISDAYAGSIDTIEPGVTALTGPSMISTLLSSPVSPETLQQAAYWVNNLLSPVRFAQAFQRLCIGGVQKSIDGIHFPVRNIDICLEIGPHHALRGPIRDILVAQEKNMTYLSTLQRGYSGINSLLQATGELWCLGQSPDMMLVNNEGMEAKKNNMVSLTNLPAYPWNHTHSYFHESTVSKNHRLRSGPRSPLLGESAADWNCLEARWRNIIKISEHLWVEDHRINGAIIFPAAGMVAMAVEAIKQVSQATRPIIAYELRNINLSAALIIPDQESGIQTQFFLRRTQSNWSGFRLCALVKGGWEEICHGKIRIYYESPADDSGVGAAKATQNHLQDIHKIYTSMHYDEGANVNLPIFYKELREYGLEFGPAFQTLQTARVIGNKSAAQIKVYNGAPDEWDYVVHPCTLDALFHMPMLSLVCDNAHRKSTAIPSKVHRVWLAAKGWKPPSTKEAIHATSIVVSKARREAEVQSSALTSDGSMLLAELEGIRLTVINDMSTTKNQEESIQNTHAWKLLWLPDIDLMSKPEINQWCTPVLQHNDDEPFQFYEKLTLLHYHYLNQVVRAASYHDPAAYSKAPHLRQYLHWAMEQIQKMGSSDNFHLRSSLEDCSTKPNHMDQLEDWLANTSPQGKAHVVVARHLQRIFHSDIDPLELLFASPLLVNMYAEFGRQKNMVALSRYLQLYSHKHPDAAYIEIGTGTGGSTTPILQSLAGDDDNQASMTDVSYSSFTATDISETFLKAARTQLARFPNIYFKTLDIERPVVDQGYTSTSYDVVVAANVLHVASDLLNVLHNVQRLLRPGGKLVLIEIVKPDIGRSGFIMGLLPGWWRSSESYRTQGPCIQTKTWHSLLQAAGFTGVDHEFPDFDGNGCHEISVLVSTKTTPSAPRASVGFPPVNIFSWSTPQEAQSHYTSTLNHQLLQMGLRSKVINIANTKLSDTDANALAIIAVDLEKTKSYLDFPDSDSFRNIQRVLRNAKNIVWLTRNTGDGSSTPQYGLVNGLGRVCNTELEGVKFVLVGMELRNCDFAHHSHLLARVIQQMLTDASCSFETEFEEREGLLYICRLREDLAAQERIGQRLSPKLARNLAWRDAPPLKLTTKTPGILESLCFTEDYMHSTPLAEDEVEIEVRAIGLNFKDCLIALGRVPSDTLGSECAGVVIRVGTAFQDKFRVGDRVCMSTTETFKTYARSKVQTVYRLLSSVSFTEAAAIPTQFGTAWMSIVNISRLQKGETILIHAGAGGIGQASIQISQYVGAEVFVTVSSQNKKQTLMTEYQIPDDHVFYSRDTSFAMGIKHATNGRGVDVVLNSLAGDSLLASWESLAPFGRFVEIGKKDILENASLPMLPFHKSVTFSAFDGSVWLAERRDEAERVIATIMDLFEKNIFHCARPLNLYPISHIQKAFSEIANGKNSGKIVLDVRSEAIVPTTLLRTETYSFDTQATYIVAGGLGGIGRCIARWMVERGARNLILLSRSGPSTPEACSLLESLRAVGIRIEVPACDISDVDALRLTLTECKKYLPPIRGCIQAAMVLQDTLLTKMTHSQWTEALKPKATGSWNLHLHLPADLDFFILLSSVSGIVGQRGQSNYAAGNTFQDSLARYRIHHGQTATAIDLGAMVDDGFIAENPGVRDRLLASGTMFPITRDKFLAILDYYCDPAVARRLTVETAQVIFGIKTPAAMHASELGDEPEWLSRPVFRFLQRASPNITERDNEQSRSSESWRSREESFRAEFLVSGSLEGAGDVVARALVAKVARSLSGVLEEDMNMDRPILGLGVDSLLAVEIRSWISKIFQADVSTFEVLGGASFVAVGRMAAGRSSLEASRKLSV